LNAKYEDIMIDIQLCANKFLASEFEQNKMHL